MSDQPDPGASLRSRLRGLRPALLVTGALIAAFGIAVIIAVVVHRDGAARAIRVTLIEYHIAMPIHLHSGRHAFKVTNRGTEPHELVVLRTGLAAASLPRDGSEVDEASPLLHVVADTGGSLPPGATRSVIARLTPGHYVAICDLPSHYGLGMRVDITVTG